MGPDLLNFLNNIPNDRLRILNNEFDKISYDTNV